MRNGNKDEWMPYYSVVRTDGTVIKTVRSRRIHVAMDAWGPGTWLGSGETMEEAEECGKRLAERYREKYQK